MEILNKKGFTLVELLVVIAIIAVLLGVLLPNFMGARERAEDSKKKQEMQSIKNALRLFYNDAQGYPPTGNIGSTLSGYMPNILSIGFTYNYYQINNGDGFQLCSEMATGAEDSKESQKRCFDNFTNAVCGGGLTENENLYVVCAN